MSTLTMKMSTYASLVVDYTITTTQEFVTYSINSVTYKHTNGAPGNTSIEMYHDYGVSGVQSDFLSQAVPKGTKSKKWSVSFSRKTARVVNADKSWSDTITAVLINNDMKKPSDFIATDSHPKYNTWVKTAMVKVNVLPIPSFTVHYEPNLPTGYSISYPETWYEDQRVTGDNLKVDIFGPPSASDAHGNERKFSYWTTDAAGKGTRYSPGTKYSGGDMTLYAQWGLPQSDDYCAVLTADGDLVFMQPSEAVTDGAQNVEVEDLAGNIWNGTTFTIPGSYASTPTWIGSDYALKIKKAYCARADEDQVQYVPLSTMKRFFAGCSNLEEVDMRGFDITNVDTMGAAFVDCKSLKSVDMGFLSWNPPEPPETTFWQMQSMFMGCESAIEIVCPSMTNPCSAGSISNMFDGCKSLVSVDISSMDFNNTEGGSDVFKGCESLVEVTMPKMSLGGDAEFFYATSMFEGCTSLKRVDLSAWSGTAILSMEHMFDGCTSLESFTWPEGVSLLNVESLESMFAGCDHLIDVVIYSTAGPDPIGVTSQDVPAHGSRETINYEYMFADCSRLRNAYLPSLMTKLYIDRPENASVCSTIGMFYGCDSLENLCLSPRLFSFTYVYNELSLTSGDPQFPDTEGEWKRVVCWYGWGTDKKPQSTTDMDGTWQENWDVESHSRDYIVGSGNTPYQLETGYGQYRTNFSHSALINWFSKSTDYHYDSEHSSFFLKKPMFASDNAFAIADCAESSATYGDMVFFRSPYRCWYTQSNGQNLIRRGMEDIDGTVRYGFLFPNVETYIGGGTTLWADTVKLNTKRIYVANGQAVKTPLYISGWFSTFIKLESFDGNGLDTSDTTNFTHLFLSCNKMTEFKWGDIDLSEAINMYGMFRACKSLETIDLSRTSAPKVTNMGEAFYECSSATEILLPSSIGSDLAEGTSISTEGMFKYCASVPSIDMSSIPMDKVSSFSEMFMGCSSLEDVVWPYGNRSADTDFSRAFMGCETLGEIDLSPFDGSSVTNATQMFENCVNLAHADMSMLDLMSTESFALMFHNCSSLLNVTTSVIDTDYEMPCVHFESMFEGCVSMKSLDLGKFGRLVLHVDGGGTATRMFAGCSRLSDLDISNMYTHNAVTADDSVITEMFDGVPLKRLVLSANFTFPTQPENSTKLRIARGEYGFRSKEEWVHDDLTCEDLESFYDGSDPTKVGTWLFRSYVEDVPTEVDRESVGYTFAVADGWFEIQNVSSSTRAYRVTYTPSGETEPATTEDIILNPNETWKAKAALGTQVEVLEGAIVSGEPVYGELAALWSVPERSGWGSTDQFELFWGWVEQEGGARWAASWTDVGASLPYTSGRNRKRPQTPTPGVPVEPAQIETEEDEIMIVGEIRAYAGDYQRVHAPDAQWSSGDDMWLLCDGSEYAVDGEYALLAQALEETDGSGGYIYNDSNTQSGDFKVPNLVGKVITQSLIGGDEDHYGERFLGKSEGETSITLTQEQTPLVSHGHDFTQPTYKATQSKHSHGPSDTNMSFFAGTAMITRSAEGDGGNKNQNVLHSKGQIERKKTDSVAPAISVTQKTPGAVAEAAGADAQESIPIMQPTMYMNYLIYAGKKE